MGKSSGDYDSPSRARPERRGNQWHWLDYDLTLENKQELKALVESGDLSPEDVFDLTDAGLELRITADRYGGGLRAMLVDRQFDNTGDQYVVTGRGSTARKAVCSLLYRHFVVAQEDWSFFLTKTPSTPEYD